MEYLTRLRGIKDKVKTLPKSAGVYLMKNIKGDIIYIGKAKNLKNRVGSYFVGAKDNKTTSLVQNIADFEFFIVNTEEDALFLESNLVNKHKPKYNVLLKDDKRFPYISLLDKIKIVRKPDERSFGPYFHGISAGILLDIIRTIFNNDKDEAEKFLNGKYTKKVAEILRSRMDKASELLQFELALAYRNGLQCLARLGRRVANVPEDATAFTLGACRELGEILGLQKTPRRIECYDISHTDGENQVASMIVFIDGVADKSQYRKFKIKHGMGNNDFLSMNETLTRRLKHKEWATPDLIVIDGGKGQLSAVETDGIPTVSLAKKFEIIYKAGDDRPIILSRGNFALRLLQRMRDEAHRFAITFHRKLRGKKITGEK
ncbi:MAG: GIY-YIG nuclease family protein [Christensenellaceae bacterium]|jgi:excinuclease ABC subunit C|nr:GIY-YIG nuclease family protein [Christensenellaceae bacterium]